MRNFVLECFKLLLFVSVVLLLVGAIIRFSMLVYDAGYKKGRRSIVLVDRRILDCDGDVLDSTQIKKKYDMDFDHGLHCVHRDMR